MYSYEARMKAVQLFIQYDYSSPAVIHELGYPSRGMLYYWYKEYIETGALRSDDMLRHATSPPTYTMASASQPLMPASVGYSRSACFRQVSAAAFLRLSSIMP